MRVVIKVLSVEERKFLFAQRLFDHPVLFCLGSIKLLKHKTIGIHKNINSMHHLKIWHWISRNKRVFHIL
jgi:hypothetical protein